jgi:hypothetical protein
LVAAALAINTALYSAVHILVFRELPVHDPGTLAIIEIEQGRPVSQASLDALEGNSAFRGVAGVVPGSESPVDAGVFISTATASLVDVLGVAPVRGTWLTPNEPEGVVVAWSLWQSRFHGQLTAIGTPVDIAGRRRMLLGVMPQGFDFPLGTNMWELARRPTGAGYSRSASLTAIARFGAPPRERHVSVGSQTATVVPLQERYTPSAGPALTLLICAAGLVLILTVLHLMGSGLIQATRLRADVGIRVALGADRRHLIRQALAEASIPAVGGLLAAVPLTILLQSSARWWLPPALLRGSALTFDWAVLAFGAILAIGVLASISLMRHLVIPWGNPKHAIETSGTGRPGIRRVGRTILVLQTSCAVALVYLCILAVTSLQMVQQMDLGFQPTGLLRLVLPWAALDGQRAQVHLLDETLEAISTVPGVSSAAPTFSYPFTPFHIGATAPLPGGDTARVAQIQIGPGYFKTIGARLISGRDFNPHGEGARVSPAIVNESLARALTRDGELPRTVQLAGLSREIIGVVENVRMRHPEMDDGFQAYIEHDRPGSSVLVRVANDESQRAALVASVQAVWGGKPVRVERVQDRLSQLLVPQRTRSALMSGVALAGLVLTMVALVGGLAEGVRNRTRELALRVAIGATQRQMVLLVVSEGLLMVIIASTMGLGVGILTGHSLASIFPGTGGLNVPVALTVIGLFILVGLTVTIQAALMACRVNPAVALKDE